MGNNRLIDLEKRRTTFEEVDTGLSLDEALKESQRCLHCKNPLCEKGCPVEVEIKDFIEYLKNQNLEDAYQTILRQNLLPSICGRVCPQEKQCQKHCVLGIKGNSIQIGKLERFVGDHYQGRIQFDIQENGIKVGIIGSGPAGLTCAIELRKAGFDVTIFEALHDLGGVLSYGIPEFRLPKDVLKKELEILSDLGIKIQKNIIIGKSFFLEDLRNMGYKEFFMATGAGLPNKLNIEGENLCNVEYANGFLTRVNLMKAYDFPNMETPFNIEGIVGVVGAGNVALDAARTALRLHAKKVYIIYRRSMEEAPARKEELDHAMEEGIEFLFLHNPVKIMGLNKIESVVLEIMKLVEDGANRKRPVGTKEYITLPIDHLIIAVGQSANPTFFENHTVDQNEWNNVLINKEGRTSIEDLYAGGDIVTGAATVISAMGQGKLASKSIIQKYRK